MVRTSLKIVGASGQGIDSIGEILAKALKRAGYCVFGYREYPSLIKGGHASYQLDFSDEYLRSSETKVDIVMTLNHHGLEKNVADLKSGGILIHLTEGWTFSKENQKIIDDRGITVVEVPVPALLTELRAAPILGNIILTAFLWEVLGRKTENLKSMVKERFAQKKDLLELNMQCIDKGVEEHKKHESLILKLPSPKSQWSDHMLLTGSKAMGLGSIHAGCRVYAGYPMTPSSPLLSYIASVQNETGMVIKQAEDEITAAQVMSGAMLMGTRAMTATSGGGFDLMSETVSLDGIVENPAVFVLAQRPGPGTGLPTWTAQGDLNIAIHSGHGEFARCVMSASDATDAFSLMNDAFNIAELYQTPVIVLTDKQIAEALYTEDAFDQKAAKIERGLVTDAAKLKKLKSTDRYDPTAKGGISPRWLPGTEAATYVAQGDEHSADGSIDESGPNAKEQLEKRVKKLETMKKNLPEPVLFGAKETDELDVLLIGWGSTKPVVLDALKNLEGELKIGYLHYTYLWPLKTELLKKLQKNAKKTVIVEGNGFSQLGAYLKQASIQIDEEILKYDGRPFFVDELEKAISSLLSATR